MAQDQPPDDPRQRLDEMVRALTNPETWRRLQEQARTLTDPELWRRVREQARVLSDPATLKRAQEQARVLSDPEVLRRVQEQARVLSDPATWRRAQEQARVLSDPEVLRRVQEQARVLSDPARWKRAQEQARVLSDPSTWQRAQQQAHTLSDPKIWGRVQDQARRLSDPARWERARADLRILTDAAALRDAEVHLASVRAGLRRLQEQVEPVADSTVLDEVRAATPTGPEAANNLEAETRYWAEDLASVAGLSPALLEPEEIAEGEFAWVGVLPTLVQMELWAKSLSVLNIILLAAATMGVSAVPLAVVLAAEVLIRLIDALSTYLSGEQE